MHMHSLKRPLCLSARNSAGIGNFTLQSHHRLKVLSRGHPPAATFHVRGPDLDVVFGTLVPRSPEVG
eukprot:3654975-Rhodomonas_salina.1